MLSPRLKPGSILLIINKRHPVILVTMMFESTASHWKSTFVPAITFLQLTSKIFCPVHYIYLNRLFRVSGPIEL